MQTRFLNTDIDVGKGLLPDKVSAAVFDCDGLLADTESLWLDSVVDYAQRRNIAMEDPSLFRGLSIEETARLFEIRGSTDGHAEVRQAEAARTLTEDFESLATRHAAPVSGAVPFIRAVAQHVPTAIASNSPRHILDRILQRIGLEDMIASSVARDEVGAAKPAPDIYVEALAKLRARHPGVSAHTTVAFEDSPVGTRAAMSAGLLVIGINADPRVDLACHARYEAITDSRLTRWAGPVRTDARREAPSIPLAVGVFEGSSRMLQVSYSCGDARTAGIAVHRQERCTWDALPVEPAERYVNLSPELSEVTIDLSGLTPGTYRYFLLTDGELSEWNGRTGEFTVGCETIETPPPPHSTAATVAANQPGALEAMSWNLWFGGCHSNDGLIKQADYLTAAPHHVVALQECFDVHGRRLAERLGWNIAQQGPDTAVISRYPLTLHNTSTSPFATCATVVLPQGPVTVWSVHLWHSDYGPYTGDDPLIPAAFTLATPGERQRTAQLAEVLVEQRRLESAGLVAGTSPVLIIGDFNVPSHLDWRKGMRGNTIEWPCSRMLQIAGFDDAFRTIHPDPGAVPGHTWSPILPGTEEPRDRIDFVYFRGMEALESFVVADDPDSSLGPAAHWVGRRPGFMGRHLNNQWPTDHAAVVARLRFGDGDATGD